MLLKMIFDYVPSRNQENAVQFVLLFDIVSGDIAVEKSGAFSLPFWARYLARKGRLNSCLPERDHTVYKDWGQECRCSKIWKGYHEAYAKEKNS